MLLTIHSSKKEEEDDDDDASHKYIPNWICSWSIEVAANSSNYSSSTTPTNFDRTKKLFQLITRHRSIVVAGAQFPNHHKAGRWTPWSIALFFDRSAHCFELPRTPPPTDAGTNEGVSEHKTQEIYSAPQSLRLSNMCRHDYIHASVTGNRVAKIRQVAAEIPPQSSFEFLQYPADQFI